MSSDDQSKRIATSSGPVINDSPNIGPNKIVTILKEANHILKTKGTRYEGWLKNADLVEVKLIIEKAIQEKQKIVSHNPDDYNKPIATSSGPIPRTYSNRKRKLSLDEDSSASSNKVFIILQKAINILNTKQTTNGWLHIASREKVISMVEEAINGLQKLPIPMSASTSQPKELIDEEYSSDDDSPKVVKILQKAMRILNTKQTADGWRNVKSIIGDALEELQKPPKNINEMTDDCLLLVFEKFPLQTMLSKFRGVCHRWRDVIDGQICERKRTLMIFGKVKNVRDYDRKLSRYNLAVKEHITLQPIGRDNDLILPLFHQRGFNSSAMGLCDLLVKLFPNIENLVLGIYISTSQQVKRFQLMTSRWTKLNGLTLAFPRISTPLVLISKQHEQPQLNLKSLNIIHSEIYNSTPLFQFISPNLSHLSFIFNGNYDKLDPLLAQLPPNLHSLHLQTIDTVNDSLSQFLERLKPKLTDNVITSLTLAPIKKSETVSDICRLFLDIVQLDLNFTYRDTKKILISDLVSLLNSLSKLTTLTLGPIAADLGAQVSTKFSLPTVKNLTINELSFYAIYNGKLLFSTMLNIFFPHLEHLTAKWEWGYTESSYLKGEHSENPTQFPRSVTISSHNANRKLYAGRHGEL